MVLASSRPVVDLRPESSSDKVEGGQGERLPDHVDQLRTPVTEADHSATDGVGRVALPVRERRKGQGCSFNPADSLPRAVVASDPAGPGQRPGFRHRWLARAALVLARRARNGFLPASDGVPARSRRPHRIRLTASAVISSALEGTQAVFTQVRQPCRARSPRSRPTRVGPLPHSLHRTGAGGLHTDRSSALTAGSRTPRPRTR